MISHKYKKLIKYCLHIFDEVTSKEIDDNECILLSDNLFHLIDNINKETRFSDENKNYYTKVLDEIYLKLKNYITDIKEQLNSDFEIIVYEQKYYELQDYIIKLNYVLKFLDSQIKFYFDTDFYEENNLVKYFHTLWNTLILENCYTRISEEINFYIFNTLESPLNLKNTITIFKLKFTDYYQRLIDDYLNFAKSEYNDMKKDINFHNNPFIFFDIYKDSYSKQTKILCDYFIIDSSKHYLNFIKKIFLDDNVKK